MNTPDDIMGMINTEVAEDMARDAADHRSTKAPLPCGMCGGPHPFDTSIPSPTWNRIVRAQGLPDFLCLTCIVAIFAKAGEPLLTATLYGNDFYDVGIEIRINSLFAQDVGRISESNSMLQHGIEKWVRADERRRCFTEAAKMVRAEAGQIDDTDDAQIDAADVVQRLLALADRLAAEGGEKRVRRSA